MLNLRGPNTKSKSAKSAVGGSVGVTADDGSTWKGEALLRADDMDDTLALVAEAEVSEAKCLHVFF